ncbi:hypothetical protein TMEN_5559, partial [Trichophyton mentagrophytes]
MKASVGALALLLAQQASAAYIPSGSGKGSTLVRRDWGPLDGGEQTVDAGFNGNWGQEPCENCGGEHQCLNGNCGNTGGNIGGGIGGGGWWGGDNGMPPVCYPVPGNTVPDCTPEQHGGFDWINLIEGAIEFFGGCDFTGFTCVDGFVKGALEIGGKVITALLGAGDGNAPTISRPEGALTITTIEIVAEVEVEIVLEFSMSDGSICRQFASCGPSLTTVVNEQCGGAVSVSFHLAVHSKVSVCAVAIKKINFGCEPPTLPTLPFPPPFPTPSLPPPETPVPSISWSTGYTTIPGTSESGSWSLPPTGTNTMPSSYSMPTSGYTTVPGPVPSSSIPSGGFPTTGSGGIPGQTTVPSSPAPTTWITQSTSTVFTTSTMTITSCPPDVPNCPTGSTTVITSTVPVYTTVCPVTMTTAIP